MDGLKQNAKKSASKYLDLLITLLYMICGNTENIKFSLFLTRVLS
jgi:hypothetical protein